MDVLINLGYLVAAVLFILGIKGLTSPKTAVTGNRMSASAMLIAIIAALLDGNVITYEYIILGVLIGGAIGVFVAKKVAMTDMPEMVATLNGVGGGASLLVAAANYLESQKLAEMGKFAVTYDWSVAVILSILIGAVTLTGSLVAVGKLKGKIGDSNKVSLYKWIVKLCFLTLIAGALYFAGFSQLNSDILILGLIVVCLILGVCLVMPIGGADMPVVVSLLNSYSGLAGAAAGFVLGNNGLIVVGSLVGASGIILTSIMCKAMNRSLTNVLFGGSMSAKSSVTKLENDAFYDGKVKFSNPEELAIILESSQKVVFVPGYGLAVAQAQHATRELANMLEANGTEVKYAIHPVAGRMPGHMNVLLAEAEVPYDQLVEMETINPEFSQTDVAIVLGANDVVNPGGANDPDSPIYGMPILNVHHAKTVVVIKRGLSPGFAGIPNELFIRDNALMVTGDAKKVLQDTISALKDL
jgi:NAD(P) transhydrogenase subunit beta